MDIFLDTNVWVAISFFLFAALAYMKGKDAILAIFDLKIEAIRSEIEDAENMRIEAQELLAQYQRKNREAEKQAKEIIANAEKRVAEMKDQAQQRITDDMNRREDQLQKRIALMEERALAQIHNRAAEITLAATGEIIATTLTKKDNEALNKEVLQSLSSHTLH